MEYIEHLVSARQIKCSKGEHDYTSRKQSDGWCVVCENCGKKMQWERKTGT